MGWQQRQDSRVRDAEPRAEFPWIQWVNRGSDLDPRHQIGGFFITSINLSLLGDPQVPGGEACSLTVGGGEDYETGLYLPAIEVAVMGSRFAWMVRENNRTQLSDAYTPGARGKLQALTLLRTATEDGEDFGWVGPILLTVTGTLSKDLGDAIKQHRQVVRQATAGQGATAWFWMHLLAGAPERRGSGSATSLVTPLLYQQDDFDPDKAYIGDDAADFVEGMFDQVQTWEAEWGQHAGSQGALNEPEPEPDPYHQSQAQPQGQAAGIGSMSEARRLWSEQWNRLKQMGLTAPFLDNAYSVGQIEAATHLMSVAATKLGAGEPVEIVAAELITALEKV